MMMKRDTQLFRDMIFLCFIFMHNKMITPILVQIADCDSFKSIQMIGLRDKSATKLAALVTFLASRLLSAPTASMELACLSNGSWADTLLKRSALRTSSDEALLALDRSQVAEAAAAAAAGSTSSGRTFSITTVVIFCAAR